VKVEGGFILFDDIKDRERQEELHLFGLVNLKILNKQFDQSLLNSVQ